MRSFDPESLTGTHDADLLFDIHAAPSAGAALLLAGLSHASLEGALVLGHRLTRLADALAARRLIVVLQLLLVEVVFLESLARLARHLGALGTAVAVAISADQAWHRHPRRLANGTAAMIAYLHRRSISGP